MLTTNLQLKLEAIYKTDSSDSLFKLKIFSEPIFFTILDIWKLIWDALVRTGSDSDWVPES